MTPRQLLADTFNNKKHRLISVMQIIAVTAINFLFMFYSCSYTHFCMRTFSFAMRTFSHRTDY